MTSVTYPHVEVTSEGVAYITGTQTKVLEVALDRIAHHWDADEIHRQHPHLSLGQIYAALAYYFDHKEELDAKIEDDLRFVERSRASAGESLVRAILKGSGEMATRARRMTCFRNEHDRDESRS